MSAVGVNISPQKNNTSGYRGVHLNRARNKWSAQIRIEKQSRFLGEFLTPEEAYAAYCKAAAKYHPYNPVTNYLTKVSE